MRIIVCGGRHFRDRLWLYAGLDRLHELAPITELIEGGADGADRFAGEWADAMKISHTVVPARWSAYGKRAGYVRNAEMIELRPDYVLAAPGGPGTAMMVAIAQQRAVPVVMLTNMDVIRSRTGTDPGG